MVGVAQLVRAPDCGSGGRGFETRHSPHSNLPVVIQITETFNSARKSWLKWAHEHGAVVWLASWSPEKM
jgi:hypothetical protein